MPGEAIQVHSTECPDRVAQLAHELTPSGQRVPQRTELVDAVLGTADPGAELLDRARVIAGPGAHPLADIVDAHPQVVTGLVRLVPSRGAGTGMPSRRVVLGPGHESEDRFVLGRA